MPQLVLLLLFILVWLGTLTSHLRRKLSYIIVLPFGERLMGDLHRVNHVATRHQFERFSGGLLDHRATYTYGIIPQVLVSLVASVINLVTRMTDDVLGGFDWWLR